MSWKIVFYKMFWQELYYNFTHGMKSLWRYRKIVWKMRDWDYRYILEMQKFQLEQLRARLINGYEVDESRLPKVADIDRCIELLHHRLEDSYVDRVGGLNSYKYKFVFDPIIYEGEQYYELREQRTEAEQEEDRKRMTASHELDNAEWEELWDIIKKGQKSQSDLRGWWD